MPLLVSLTNQTCHFILPLIGQKLDGKSGQLDRNSFEVVQLELSKRDGGTQNACRVHEKGAQTGDETLSDAQVGSTLAAEIEDAQLMFDEQPAVQAALSIGVGAHQ